MAKEIRWTVPAIAINMHCAMCKCWSRIDAPAHLPEFFVRMRDGQYYDRVGICWGVPVYRERQRRACDP